MCTCVVLGASLCAQCPFQCHRMVHGDGKVGKRLRVTPIKHHSFGQLVIVVCELGNLEVHKAKNYSSLT